MTLSVVIPARDAAQTLPRVLTRLVPQLDANDEVIVIDDGSRDGTAGVVAAFQKIEVRVLAISQPPSGAAAARNRGLRRARGDLVLFLGADILPDRRLLERHRAVHRQFPEETIGCLGLVSWDPELPPTPFMVWLEHGGSQNAYGLLAGSAEADPRRFCYGSNLSLKRRFLQRVGGFDAVHFHVYGWEDLDLGLRLARAGCRLVYEPTARGWHAHAHTVASFLDRQRAAGFASVTLESLHPGALLSKDAGVSTPWSILPYSGQRGLTHTTERLARRWILAKVYGRLTRWVFTDGVQAALLGQARLVENTLPLFQESAAKRSGFFRSGKRENDQRFPRVSFNAP